MAEMLKCLSCGKFTRPGPAKCEHCGAPLRGAPRVEVTLSVPAEGGAPATPVPVTSSRVVVTDFDMPFGSMVAFMVKWTLASIPALIILLILGMIFVALFGGVFSHM